MANRDMLENVSISLLRKGFTVKGLTGSCFDLIARKGSRILLLKFLSDANAISEQHAKQMQNLSSYMGASPFVIAEKAGNLLEDNVVYSRSGIYTFNHNTFNSCIDGRFPFIASTNAGLTANVVADKLKKKREEAGLSLAQLSNRIGVSRRMVAKYESSDGKVTITKAERIYDILGHEVFDKIDVFNNNFISEKSSTPITRKYSALGFEASQTKKVPFDVIARKDNELILTELGDKINSNMSSVSRLLDADNLVIFNKKRPKDIPALTKEEFMEFEKANELIKFLKGF